MRPNRVLIFLLKTALRNPATTIVLVLILFFVTILSSMSVSVNKLSDLETDQIKVYVTMATGSTLETTDKLVGDIEKAVKDVEEIKDENLAAEAAGGTSEQQVNLEAIMHGCSG